MTAMRYPVQSMLVALLCMGCLTVTQAAVPHPEKEGPGAAVAATKNRIVIQVNEDSVRKWHDVIVNIHNIQADLGEKNVAIAVVAIGAGLGMIKADSLEANGVQEALATGVEFVACGNSMRGQKLVKDDLVEGVTVARAGYVEILRRQQQGWIYLRP